MVDLPGAMVPRGDMITETRPREPGSHTTTRPTGPNPEACFVLGMLAIREGRCEQALPHIEEAIARDGANPDYYYGLGTAQLRLGRLEAATRSLRHALELQPDHAEALNDIGKIRVQEGLLEAAIEAFQAALRSRPDLAEAYLNLGLALEARGRLDEAATSYCEAARLRPDHAEPFKNLGIVNARRARLDEAIAAFRQYTRLRSDDPDVLNELGILYSRQGRFEEAVAAYHEAIRLRSGFADAHNNLGNALRNQGQLDEAIACFEEALRLRPRYAECRNNLGIALKHKGKAEEAIACYETALAWRPDYPEAHNNLGIALAERSKLEGAVICFQQAVRLRPDYVEAQANLANALSDLNRLPEAVDAYRRAIQLRPADAQLHKNLGIALSKADRLDDAVASFREAVGLKPDFADAHNDLGIALSRQNQFEAAINSYQEALRHRPNYAEALNNLGNALRNAGRFVESLECYHKAVKLRPNYFDAFNNLGIAYAEMGRFEEAINSYTQCLRLRPLHVDAHLNRALTWLRKGDFAQGWAEYEWRWRKRNHPPRTVIQPLWNGSDPAGRRILLITEQGLGDTIQFIRYVRRLKDRGATVILECPEPLVKLMGWVPGLDQIVTRESGPPPDHDVYCPILTLPGLMGSSSETFPAEVPYIHPDPELVAHWRRELGAGREFKIGINWQGNPGYAGDRHRSVPLVNLEAIARVPGVRLYSLQKNHGLEQLQGIADKFAVTELGSRLDVNTGPFLDTAAVMKNLDLFITSDTAVAHLAGALGVRTWMAVSTTPDWRWLTVREDNPWYPTMRLFRQAEFLQWRPVFERMAAELATLVGASPRSQPIVAQIAPGELLDKLTILQIKAERIRDTDKLRNVHTELEALTAVRTESIVESPALAKLVDELRAVNEVLWRVEDDIRACELAGDFGPRFIELARAVYKTNDHRAAVKKQINALLGSAIVEEKAYTGS